ncbi:MAG: peroxiredoxin family protein [Candidatus Acidiferrales bacterium]
MNRRGILVLAVFVLSACALAAQEPLSSTMLPPSTGAPNVGDKVSDFTLPDIHGQPVKLATLRSGSLESGKTAAEVRGYWELLIFYRGAECANCNAELRSIQDNLKLFESRHVRVIAVSTDSPAVSKRLCEEKGYTFMVLSDSNAAVIRKWDLLQARGSKNAPEVARPAEFLIDVAGRVRWRNLPADDKTWLHASDVLSVLDTLHVGGTGLAPI